MPLSALASRDPAAWIGARGMEATGGRPIFPLLVKLIDGQADLSIQIHPDDRAAAAAGLGTGKTEAYHVLAAEPGSVIYLGLDPEVMLEEFAASCLLANGSAAGCLRRIPAAPGMTVLIPAGTPHALGAGILLYEIQQPSNVTFRLDDWGRVDASGIARALHHREGSPSSIRVRGRRRYHVFRSSMPRRTARSWWQRRISRLERIRPRRGQPSFCSRRLTALRCSPPSPAW